MDYIKQRKALTLPMKNPDFEEEITFGEYLKQLLATLWTEEEDFSGKRPFGTSGWQFDIYKFLIENKFVSGKIDDHGYVDEMDQNEIDKFVFECIDYIFLGLGE